MKILKETLQETEALPISFITDMVSKGWDEVGYLKEAAAAISTEYKDTDKVVQLMQELMDAYLVFIGQLENYLHEEENIIVKDSDPEKDPKSQDKATKADKETDDSKESTDEDEDEDEDDADKDDDDMDFDDEDEEDDDDEDATGLMSNKTMLPTATINAKDLAVTDTRSNDPFEFFVDFDEPDMSEPRISEKELYGEEDSEYEYNKLRSQMFN